ncbi:MAG: DNA (cytosine-5-)-methyltransferase [Bacteroidales bacterium]|jgi:DNA (cytosine-5)-methyltransferase 1|nr:DNA (cytosine-5-)-methyltransferase [Bacteroidales bacterium]
MPKIHISLKVDTYDLLKQKAKSINYSVQDFVERSIELAVREPLALFSASTEYINNGKKENSLFTFIDLFAGIGGMRTAFETAGGQCVFSSEWDKYCQRTYYENFGDIPHGDITEIKPELIPDHDILIAGFPCQPFSIAGVSKKNSLGRKHGFEDKTQGTLFFSIAKILEIKRPKMFLLENVKNLKSHDKGNTYRVIKETLAELNYKFNDAVLDAINYVPQHRERIYIIGYDARRFNNDISIKFPSPPEGKKKLATILEKDVDKKYILSDHLWNYLQQYAEKHRSKGNGFGFGLVDKNKTARTLSARYYKDGSEILIKRGNYNPRRLTPRECSRLMGYDDTFKIPVSDTQAYKQFGNSVVVPLVKDIAKEMLNLYKELNNNHGNY